MIRKLLATTAIVTLVSTGAFAQTTVPATEPMAAEQSVQYMVHAEGHLASDIIGQTVYNGAHDDADNIGSVKDIVLAADGNVEAIIIGVGGFLGLGQRDVAIAYEVAEWHERDGDRYLVVPTTREALEALPEFDTAAFRPQPADAQIGHTQPATAQDLGAAAPTEEVAAVPEDDTMAPTDETVAVVPADETVPSDDEMAAAPVDGVEADTDDTMTAAIDRNSLNTVDMTGLSANELIGTTVYGANDENVGSVNDIILSQEGNAEAVIIDVGGFLGMGAKEVAVSMENLSFMSDADGNMYLYTQFTKEQLEAQPEYDATTFVETRDDQLLIAPVR